jgi:hypothetical protein
MHSATHIQLDLFGKCSMIIFFLRLKKAEAGRRPTCQKFHWLKTLGKIFNYAESWLFIFCDINHATLFLVQIKQYWQCSINKNTDFSIVFDNLKLLNSSMHLNPILCTGDPYYVLYTALLIS